MWALHTPLHHHFLCICWCVVMFPCGRQQLELLSYRRSLWNHSELLNISADSRETSLNFTETDGELMTVNATTENTVTNETEVRGEEGEERMGWQLVLWGETWRNEEGVPGRWEDILIKLHTWLQVFKALIFIFVSVCVCVCVRVCACWGPGPQAWWFRFLWRDSGLWPLGRHCCSLHGVDGRSCYHRYNTPVYSLGELVLFIESIRSLQKKSENLVRVLCFYDATHWIIFEWCVFVCMCLCV